MESTLQHVHQFHSISQHCHRCIDAAICVWILSSISRVIKMDWGRGRGCHVSRHVHQFHNIVINQSMDVHIYIYNIYIYGQQLLEIRTNMCRDVDFFFVSHKYGCRYQLQR